MSKFEHLLKKEMTRKQFLATLGVMFLSIFGFSTIMGMLTEDSSSHKKEVGYGLNDYGP